LDRSSRLVMGRGAALELKTRCPWVPKHAGLALIDKHLQSYGVVFIPGNIGLFQVKYHFKEKASTALIKLSGFMLWQYAKTNPELKYHINYPGIGNGGLTEDQVYPIIADWPDNITVWKKE
jgi:hypothetical protein